MIAKYNRRSMALGIPGLLLHIVCVVVANLLAANAKSSGATHSVALALLFAGVSFAGLLLLIIGLCFYAKAKGYSAVLGLLGLLSCIGILILAVLPDKTNGYTEDIVS